MPTRTLLRTGNGGETAHREKPVGPRRGRHAGQAGAVCRGPVWPGCAPSPSCFHGVSGTGNTFTPTAVAGRATPAGGARGCHLALHALPVTFLSEHICSPEPWPPQGSRRPPRQASPRSPRCGSHGGVSLSAPARHSARALPDGSCSSPPPTPRPGPRQVTKDAVGSDIKPGV